VYQCYDELKINNNLGIKYMKIVQTLLVCKLRLKAINLGYKSLSMGLPISELKVDKLTDLPKENAKHLKKLGVNVIHGIDTTKLDHSFKNIKFDQIIFQFPNVGSREPIDGQNPNYVLVKEFIEEAPTNLAIGGYALFSCLQNVTLYKELHRL
jgi:hypothetical protein